MNDFTMDELIKAKRKAEEAAKKAKEKRTESQKQEVNCINCKFHETIEDRILFFKLKTDYCHVYNREIIHNKNVDYFFSGLKAERCPVYENKYGYNKEK